MMRNSLEKISIEGFRSIRGLRDFEMKPLNVLIGANGAGKSNFVEFFRMLNAMANSKLEGFVNTRGGGDKHFFNGPKNTPNIGAYVAFAQNEYRFSLSLTADNKLIFDSEECKWTQLGNWSKSGSGHLESKLPEWKNEKSSRGDWPSFRAYIYEAISSWLVYHFHDTTRNAGIRRESSIHYWHTLEPHAENIAPVLLHLRNENGERYNRIFSTIRLVAPFLDDFFLETYNKGDEELVRLQWYQKGSKFLFQPYHFSDGTIRFICLVTALLQPNPPSTIVIDEPELGLHPYALSVLAELIKETSLSTQLVVATQSVTLLNHFAPEDVIVVDRIDGASEFRRLDPAGLKDWLDQYSLGELWEKNVLDGGPRHE